MPEPATGPIAADPLPSSSERSSSSAFQLELKEGAESDEEISRVPEIGGDFAGGGGGTLASGKHRSQGQAAGDGGIRKTGRNTADKESKRLKRLLRNRVSAQQARERKKAYLNDMEIRAKNLEKRNSELEEKVSTLQNENQMLRHILKNTTAGKKSEDGSGDADKINPSSAEGC